MDRRSFIVNTSASALALLSVSDLMASSKTAQPAPGMPSPKFFTRNNIRMAVYEKGEGVPVIFCHGFPELAYSWRHQFNSVAKAGFHAIAPDLRGSGLTSQPTPINDYAATEVCDDLVAMMDKMNLSKAIFCGHDWGGFITHLMGLIYPERCLGMIGVGSPHRFRPHNLPRVETKVEELVDKAAWNRFMQQLDIPEQLLDNNVRNFLTKFMRRGYITADHLKTLPEDSIERKLDLPEILAKKNVPGEIILPEDALDYYVEIFSATGFAGGINWYRAMGKSMEEIGKRNQTWEVNFPYLYIAADQDPIIRPGEDAGMEDYISDLERKTILDCGHFVMEDKPEELSEILVEWLNRKYPSIA